MFAVACDVVSRILHVEDDPSLRALVELSFRGFGFRGEVVDAATVSQAERVLAEAARSPSGRFDLIISDMHLPDGTGLDLVRHVRATPAWRSTPLLILSSDVDPKRVGSAYALGANAYVDKAPRGRPPSEVMKSLYDHWAKDVLLPPTPSGRLQAFLSWAIEIRARYAHLYHRFADDVAPNASEAAFWLSRALSESNMVNLLRFLAIRIDEQDVPDEILDGMERMANGHAKVVAEVEQRMDARLLTPEDAYRAALDLLPGPDLGLMCQAIGRLFPIVPTAMEALRVLLIGTIDDVTRWIELHTGDDELRTRAARVRVEGAAFSKETEALIGRAPEMP